MVVAVRVACGKQFSHFKVCVEAGYPRCDQASRIPISTGFAPLVMGGDRLAGFPQGALPLVRIVRQRLFVGRQSGEEREAADAIGDDLFTIDHLGAADKLPEIVPIICLTVHELCRQPCGIEAVVRLLEFQDDEATDEQLVERACGKHSEVADVALAGHMICGFRAYCQKLDDILPRHFTTPILCQGKDDAAFLRREMYQNKGNRLVLCLKIQNRGPWRVSSTPRAGAATRPSRSLRRRVHALPPPESSPPRG